MWTAALPNGGELSIFAWRAPGLCGVAHDHNAGADEAEGGENQQPGLYQITPGGGQVVGGAHLGGRLGGGSVLRVLLRGQCGGGRDAGSGFAGRHLDIRRGHLPYGKDGGCQHEAYHQNNGGQSSRAEGVRKTVDGQHALSYQSQKEVTIINSEYYYNIFLGDYNTKVT